MKKSDFEKDIFFTVKEQMSALPGRQSTTEWYQSQWLKHWDHQAYSRLDTKRKKKHTHLINIKEKIYIYAILTTIRGTTRPTAIC